MDLLAFFAKYFVIDVFIMGGGWLLGVVAVIIFIGFVWEVLFLSDLHLIIKR